MADITTTPALLHHAAGSAYFSTSDGKAVFLEGDHTWTNNISFSDTGQFDFGAYLDLLQGEGANLIRYWNWVDARGALIEPFQKTGSGKWDLTKFNQDYFDHVARDVDAAGARGIYVSIMAFFDYDPQQRYGWSGSVWNGDNNVNGTTTSNTGIEQSDPVALPLQQAYLAKLLDTVGYKTNVLWEIANEPQNAQAAVDWENTLVNFIHQYQSDHGLLAQPVGVTSAFPEGNQSEINPMISATNADWISPNGWEDYQSNPPEATGARVQIIDSDHTFGIGGDADWVWKQFTRGHGGVNVMDDMKGTGLPGTFDLGGDYEAGETQERLALREISEVLKLIDVTAMRPNGALSSTGYALADPAQGSFVVLAPSGGTVTVDLSAASGVPLQARWVDVRGGGMSSPTALTGGDAAQAFTAPSGDAVLVLTRAAAAPPDGDEAPPGSDTLRVRLSEDAWQGDAQCFISVDGRRIGGVQTVTASHAAGESQDLVFQGDWGGGAHSVGIEFINDAYDGTPSTDRNLFVDAVSLNGAVSSQAPAAMMSAGLSTFEVSASPGGNLVLHVSEDAYQGDAQFTVAVDGRDLAGVQTATASHGAGESQAVTLATVLSAGSHDLAVTYVNDLWDGTPETDRNLYVIDAEYDGQVLPGVSLTMFPGGTQHVAIEVAL